MNIQNFIFTLREEAYSKKVLEMDLSDKHHSIVEHIMKLYFYGKKENNTNNNHWKNEIYSFLHYINLLKNNNKLPTQKFIFDNLWNKNLDIFIRTYKTAIKDLNFDYSKSYGIIKETDSDFSNIYNICKQYFEWLSDKLSKNGVVAKEEVYSKLEQLI